MKPRFNFWLEKDGQVAVSVWRVRLLAAIDATGSISQGAREMGVPYRIAWQKIHEMEEQLGEKLVETKVGGKQGGGAVVTERGRWYVDQVKRISAEIQLLLQAEFEAVFED